MAAVLTPSVRKEANPTANDRAMLFFMCSPEVKLPIPYFPFPIHNATQSYTSKELKHGKT